MDRARGFSVRIFIPSGDPAGLRVVEKSNWTGVGVVFPRSVMPEALERTELARPGVYIIWGPGKSPEMPLVYIGEGAETGARLSTHAKNKEFWTNAAVFASKDANLNKAHIQYLEARLLRRADEEKRCELDNGNVPQLPLLSDVDRADSDLFLDDLLLCLPVVGVRFLQKPGRQAQTIHPLFLHAKGIEAQGYVDSSGFVVKSGSQAVKKEVRSIHKFLSVERTALIERGVLSTTEDSDNFYTITQDYTFSSPSTAAGVLLGRSASGPSEWKDAEGRTLKDLQEEGATERRG